MNHAHLELRKTDNGKLREGSNWCSECIEQSEKARLGEELARLVLSPEFEPDDPAQAWYGPLVKNAREIFQYLDSQKGEKK